MRLALAVGQQALHRSPGFLQVPTRPTRALPRYCASWRATSASWNPYQTAPVPQRAAMATAAVGASGATGDAFPRQASSVQLSVACIKQPILSGAVKSSLRSAPDNSAARHISSALQPGQRRVAAAAPRRGQGAERHLVSCPQSNSCCRLNADRARSLRAFLMNWPC